MRVGVVVASALLVGACASIAGLDPIDPPDAETGEPNGSNGNASNGGNGSNGTSGTSNDGTSSGAQGTSSSSGQSSGTSSSSSTSSTGGIDSGQDTGPPPINENNACTTDAECTQNATYKKCSSVGGGTCQERCVAKGSGFCEAFGFASPCCNGFACKTTGTFPPTRCEDP